MRNAHEKDPLLLRGITLLEHAGPDKPGCAALEGGQPYCARSVE